MVLRLEHILNCSSRVKGEGGPQVVVEMEYLPNCSKNRYRTKEGIIKSDVRRWMNDLAWMVMSWSRSCGIELKPPLNVRIGGIFKDERSCPDVHNFVPVIADALQEGMEINDRHFRVECTIPEIDPLKTPRLIIAVNQTEMDGS